MEWEDIIKNQISVTRQKLRSSKRPLPEEDDPPDCFEKIDAIIREFNNFAKIFDEGATLIYDLEFRNQLTPEEWCTFINNLDYKGDWFTLRHSISSQSYLQAKINENKYAMLSFLIVVFEKRNVLPRMDIEIVANFSLKNEPFIDEPSDAGDFLYYNIPMMQEDVFTYEDYDDFNNKLVKAKDAWVVWCYNLQNLGKGQFTIPSINFDFFSAVWKFVDNTYNTLGYHEEEYRKRRGLDE